MPIINKDYTNYSDFCEVLIRGRKPFLRDLHHVLEKELNTKIINKPCKEALVLENIIEILDEYKFDYKLQYLCGKYKVDLYAEKKDIKLVIEVDENNHSNYNSEKENKRQKYIIENLNCKIYRINPDETHFTLRKMCKKFEKFLDSI